MIKIHVDRMTDLDADVGGTFKCIDRDTLLDYSYEEDGEDIKCITVAISDNGVEDWASLKLNKEELLFVQDQLKVKETECWDSFTVDKILECDNSLFPVSNKIRFSIKENNMEVIAHYYNRYFLGLSTNYFCNHDKKIKHIPLYLESHIKNKILDDLFRLTILSVPVSSK